MKKLTKTLTDAIESLEATYHEYAYLMTPAQETHQRQLIVDLMEHRDARINAQQKAREVFKARFKCAVCDIRPPRGDYMLAEDLWQQLGFKRFEFACLACLYRRAIDRGITITRDSFPDVPCNWLIRTLFKLRMDVMRAADELTDDTIAAAMSLVLDRMSRDGVLP